MNAYQIAFGSFKKGFFGSCALGVMVQSCLGGIAAMAILRHGVGVFQMFQLLVVVGCCLAFNGSVISVQKPQTVFNILIGACLICSAIAIANFAW